MTTVPITNEVRYTLATRKSRLALIQAQMAADYLRQKKPQAGYTLLPLSTTGDRQLQWSLEQTGGRGFFIKELEAALLEGRADLAVHSAKDLPTQMTAGLTIAGYLPRADARDMLVKRKENIVPHSIATGSPRRRAQACKRFNEVQWRDIRGSVETRLRKITDGYADATILAAAGLQRLDIHSRPGLTFQPFEPHEMVPAAGQGAIALQCRREDVASFAPLFDAATEQAITIERRALQRLGGGCHSASAAYYHNATLRIFDQTLGLRECTFPSEGPANLDAALDALLA